MRKILIPKKLRPSSDDGYLEILAKTIFQVGFNWDIVERKWLDIRRAFHGFRVHRVGNIDEQEFDALLKDSRVIRNSRKLNAIIRCAGIFLRLRTEHGSVKKYLRELRSLAYAERRKRLVKLLPGIGPTGVFVWLYTVSEPVPDWHARLD